MENKYYTMITGACGGLGNAFTYECAKNKENLLLTGTNSARLENLKQKLKNEFADIQIETFVLNLADKNNREELISFIESNNIKVSKLINNAGVIIEGDMLRFSDDEIINAIEVNCVGTVDITKKLLKIREENKLFEVLTVSSAASSYPMPHMAVYAATKAFLVSMMTALSFELKGKNVIFSTVCPGGIATTEAMKESINSMGLGGKLSATSADKVARVALKGLKKHKKVVIPGAFNKFLVFVSKPFSKSFLAKRVGKIWAKSQKKRNF